MAYKRIHYLNVLLVSVYPSNVTNSLGLNYHPSVHIQLLSAFVAIFYYKVVHSRMEFGRFSPFRAIIGSSISVFVNLSFCDLRNAFKRSRVHEAYKQAKIVLIETGFNKIDLFFLV